MEIGKTLYARNRKEWRSWLERNHDKEKEIWLIYYRKSSGKKRIAYNEAVEEALCYGWIDSTVKSVDSERFAQRFTPRRQGSSVSEMNKERIRRLIKEKRMTEFGLRAIQKVFDYSDSGENLEISPDILEQLKSSRKAWENFREFPLGYKRVRVGYIESRRRHGHEEFMKSLNHFIRMTEKSRKFGMVR